MSDKATIGAVMDEILQECYAVAQEKQSYPMSRDKIEKRLEWMANAIKTIADSVKTANGTTKVK